MAEFAKFFHFGGFKQNNSQTGEEQNGTDQQQQQQQPAPPQQQQQQHQQQQLQEQQEAGDPPSYAPEKSNTPVSKSKSSSMSSSGAHSTATNMSNFPPNIVKQTSTPTIALSSNQFAYGTTSTASTSEAFINKNVGLGGNNSNLSSGGAGGNAAQSQSHQHQQAAPQVHQQQQQQQQILKEATRAMNAIADDSQPATSIPRGKLRVTIVEAHGLHVHKNRRSLPYAVCTFESSEFITHGPESVGTTAAVPNTDLTHLEKNKNSKPIYQRQSSTQTFGKFQIKQGFNPISPTWHHQTIFDVVGAKSELDVSVYDSECDDAFLGHVRIVPQTIEDNSTNEQWIELKGRVPGERVTGKIRVKWEYFATVKRHYGPEDFEVLRLLGKGTFGQVFQVRKKDTSRIYAMKVLSKKLIVRKKEIAHTIGERNILVRTSTAASSFIVGLKFSFQTPQDLYLVTDYMSGGELFWHLQKEGRFTEDRAKFYIAELVLALEHLHDNDIVYRDLKPENILLDANGHTALCDFGLSKANLSSDGTTNTFCGTTEYLAPEVLLDESGYTKMVDFWSLGVLIFEMCCGWSPFYADNTQQMYKNIAFGKVRFPKEVLSPEGRSFVKGLLNRNPNHRLGAINDARELRAHPFFQDIDWELLKAKKIPPPFKPHLTSETDTSNFDPEFTNTSTSVINKQFHLASTPLSPAIQANFNGFTYVDESTMFDHFGSGNVNNNNTLNNRNIKNSLKVSESLVLSDPNLPPDEDVIDDHDNYAEEDDDKMDLDDDNHIDDEFVNGRFDL